MLVKLGMAPLKGGNGEAKEDTKEREVGQV